MATRRDLPLAKAVARAFNRLGFSSQDLLTGQIVHTTLPWQNPPLMCDATLDGLPLTDYLNYSLPIDIDRLYDFWLQGLQDLGEQPTKAIGPGGWRGTSAALPNVSAGERLLRLSIPEGFPEDVEPFAGQTFSMEIAQIVYLSWDQVEELVSNDHSYYVRLKDGRAIGVANGVPIAPSTWNVPLDSVQLHLQRGRGRTVTTCRYDLLAKVRSVLYESAARFDEFDGLDWALQALQRMCGDQLCAALQHAIEGMSYDAAEARRKLKAVSEALALMESWHVHDRVKITSMFEMLVPRVLKASQFQRSIFNMYQTIPAVLTPATEKKITTFLRNLKQRLERECKPIDRT